MKKDNPKMKNIAHHISELVKVDFKIEVSEFVIPKNKNIKETDNREKVVVTKELDALSGLF